MLNGKNNDYVELIRLNLSEYIGIDVDVFLDGGRCLIYGGAVRDILAGKNINDVDIVTDMNAFSQMQNILYKVGYVKKEIAFGDINSNGYDNMYDLFYLLEMNKDEKKIHIINPKEKMTKILGFSNLKDDDYDMMLLQFVRNVDFSNCSIGYNPFVGLVSFNNALQCCIQNKFYPLFDSVMYKKQLADSRYNKFIERGWKSASVYDF